MNPATPTPADARAMEDWAFNVHLECMGSPGEKIDVVIGGAVLNLRDLDKILNAALTAEIAEGATGAGNARVGEDWQPIDTAPKDGTAFLLWVATKASVSRIRIGTWSQRYCNWVSQDWRNRRVHGDDAEITHWRPLPAPPATPVGAIAEGRE